jgi:hypothetical protein
MLISGSGSSHGDPGLRFKSGFRHGICWGLTSREGEGEVPESGPSGGGRAAVVWGAYAGRVSALSLARRGKVWLDVTSPGAVATFFQRDGIVVKNSQSALAED